MLVGAPNREKGRGLSQPALLSSMLQHCLAFCVLVGASFARAAGSAATVASARMSIRGAGHHGPSAKPPSNHHGWPWDPFIVVSRTQKTRRMENNYQSNNEAVLIFDNFDLDLVVKVLSHTAFSKSCYFCSLVEDSDRNHQAHSFSFSFPFSSSSRDTS